MRANISDRAALMEISPTALSAYARTEGWERVETYGDHSDVYVGERLPEIILPRTRQLGDYHSVIARLIEIFARVAEVDELTLYRDLITADRDIVRVRIAEGDGTVDLDEGADLLAGARSMLLATACSLHDPRPLYRAGANREARDYLKQVRLGQTEQGSFVVTLMPPIIPPPLQTLLLPDPENDDAPVARQVTRRLGVALTSIRQAAERAASGDAEAFSDAVPSGASANLCEALVQMVEPFSTLDISMTWARTRPMPTARQSVSFANDDVSILREAARSFRNREPRFDVSLFGSVWRLKRDDSETDGTVTLRASVEGKIRSVTAVLSQPDYNLAIQAHKEKAPVIAEGDLDRFGQRWHLLNPRIVTVITDDDAEDE